MNEQLGMAFSVARQHRSYAGVAALVLTIVAGWPLAGPTAGQTQATRLDVDGRRYPQQQQFPHRHALLRFAPDSGDDHRTVLQVENLALHHALNQRGLEIALCSLEHPTADNTPATYSRLVLRNCEVFSIHRDEAAARQEHHIEAVRISGGGELQPLETEVLIEDLVVHDANVQPLLIQEGKFSTITLRRLRFSNLPNPQVQIVLLSGTAQRIVVDDCPNLRLLVSARPGSIGQCIVRNSPGAEVVDAPTPSGKSGLAVVTENPADPQQAMPVLKAEVKRRRIRAVVENVPTEAAAVRIELFDALDYRVGTPAVLTEGPWEANFTATRKGVYLVQCTITRLGGNPDKPLVTKVEIGK